MSLLKSVYLCLLFLSFAVAGEHSSDTAKSDLNPRTAEPPDVRVLAWTPYDNEDFFHNSNKLIPQVFCTKEKAITEPYFKAKKEHISFVEPFAPFKKENESEKWKTIKQSFESKLESQLESLEKSDRPVLVIAFHGHGLKDIICRQFRQNFLMAELVNMIFDKVDRFKQKTGKMPEIGLFMEACHAGSMLGHLKRRAKATDPDEKSYNNGDGKYRYPFELYSTAPADKVAYVGADRTGIMWTTLARQNRLRTTPAFRSLLETGQTGNRMREFCSLDGRNTHVVFSSWRKYPQTDTPIPTSVLEKHVKAKSPFSKEALMALGKGGLKGFETLKRTLQDPSSPKEEKQSAIFALGKSPKKESIPLLLEALKSKDPAVRGYAMVALANFPHTVEGFKPAFARAVETLIFDEDENVGYTARSMLQHNLRKNKAEVSDLPLNWRKIIESEGFKANPEARQIISSVGGKEYLPKLPEKTWQEELKEMEAIKEEGSKAHHKAEKFFEKFESNEEVRKYMLKWFRYDLPEVYKRNALFMVTEKPVGKTGRAELLVKGLYDPNERTYDDARLAMQWISTDDYENWSIDEVNYLVDHYKKTKNPKVKAAIYRAIRFATKKSDSKTMQDLGISPPTNAWIKEEQKQVLANNDPNDLRLSSALRYLYAENKKEAIKIAQKHKGAKDTRLFETANSILFKEEPKKFKKHILGLLKDGSSMKRLQAMKMLYLLTEIYDVAKPKDFEYPVEELLADPNEEVREKAVRWLEDNYRNFDGMADKSFNSLLRLTVSKDKHPNGIIVYNFEQMMKNGAFSFSVPEKLAEIFKKSKEPELVAAALAQSRWTNSTGQKLIESALEHSDDSIRALAVAKYTERNYQGVTRAQALKKIAPLEKLLMDNRYPQAQTAVAHHLGQLRTNLHILRPEGNRLDAGKGMLISFLRDKRFHKQSDARNQAMLSLMTIRQGLPTFGRDFEGLIRVAPYQGDPTLRTLVSELERRDPKTAETAAFTLMNIGKNELEVVTAIGKYMQEESKKKKPATITTDIANFMGRLHSPYLTPYLTSGLESKSAKVRIASINGLANLGPLAKDQIPKIKKGLEDSDPAVRKAAEENIQYLSRWFPELKSK